METKELIHTETELTAGDIHFEEEIIRTTEKGKVLLNFYIPLYFDVKAVFGASIIGDSPDTEVDVYANFNCRTLAVEPFLDVVVKYNDDRNYFTYSIDAPMRKLLFEKMSDYCVAQERTTINTMASTFEQESDKPFVFCFNEADTCIDIFLSNERGQKGLLISSFSYGTGLRFRCNEALSQELLKFNQQMNGQYLGEIEELCKQRPTSTKTSTKSTNKQAAKAIVRAVGIHAVLAVSVFLGWKMSELSVDALRITTAIVYCVILSGVTFVINWSRKKQSNDGDQSIMLLSNALNGLNVLLFAGAYALELFCPSSLLAVFVETVKAALQLQLLIQVFLLGLMNKK